MHLGGPVKVATGEPAWPRLRTHDCGIHGVHMVPVVSEHLQCCQMAKFDPFLSLDCARVEGVGAQSKERKGLNFAA